MTGILSGPVQMAIVESGGRTYIVGPGDRIKGALVKVVLSDQVIFRQNGDTFALRIAGAALLAGEDGPAAQALASSPATSGAEPVDSARQTTHPPVVSSRDPASMSSEAQASGVGGGISAGGAGTGARPSQPAPGAGAEISPPTAAPTAPTLPMGSTVFTPNSASSDPSASAPTSTSSNGPTVMLQNDGTDWGARINAADAQLGGSPGVIDAEGGGTIARQIIVSPYHTLHFGAGTWTNSVAGQETILLKDNTVLEGHGWGTVIQEAPGKDPSQLSYFIVKPYATHADGGAQSNNISVRNIQFSGVGITKPENAASSTVISGLLDGGDFENIWFNKTHSIGLTIGESNVHGNAAARNIIVRGNKFTNVGGGVPPNFTGGGGVSLAIINGDRVTVVNNTFIDALGNAVIDVEPNTAGDPITNIDIESNTVDESNSTGVFEPYTYGIVTHDQGGAFGPIMIANNRIFGLVYDGGTDANNGGWFPGKSLLVGIYIDYYGAGPEHDVTIKGNDIRYSSAFPIIIDGNSYSNVVQGNHIFMPGYNMVVTGQRNQVMGNYVATARSQNRYCFGIEERGGDYNKFANNQTTGDAQLKSNWVITANYPLNTTNCPGADLPVVTFGAHDVVEGNVLIARPAFP